jgi:hypothetical protein
MHGQQNKNIYIEKIYFNIMLMVTRQKTSPVQIRQR